MQCGCASLTPVLNPQRPYMFDPEVLLRMLRARLGLDVRDVDVLVGMDLFSLVRVSRRLLSLWFVAVNHVCCFAPVVFSMQGTRDRAANFLQTLRAKSRCRGEPAVMLFDDVFKALIRPLARVERANVVNAAKPDVTHTLHMCMPGPTDDEVTLWLLALAKGLSYELREDGEGDGEQPHPQKLWQAALEVH